MSWSYAVPNLLTGLREGLEAGLVVSILLAAVRRDGDRSRDLERAIWLGVLGAVSIAGSFAAVLTFTANALSSRAEEAVGGILSVLAVGLLTAMVFRMRAGATGISAHLRSETARALAVAAWALALTAFFSVGREGLETTLFVWSAVRASGEAAAPLIGAAAGLVAAVVLCVAMFRRAVRIDVSKFFNWTAVALIVIAAGIFSYGLGDLQDAGLLPGAQWTAFDLTAHVDPNSWWVSLISGATDLSTKMTVAQVVAWLAYLVAVLVPFLRAPSRARGETERARGEGEGEGEGRDKGGILEPSRRSSRLSERRPIRIGVVIVAVPIACAAITVALLPPASANTVTSVTVTSASCASQWSEGHAGTQTFSVTNATDRAGEIDLDNATSGGVIAAIETLGPATTVDMVADLSPGSYLFRCYLSGEAVQSSSLVTISGRGAPSKGVVPVTLSELTGPDREYEAYAAGVLASLERDVGTIRSDLVRGDLEAARSDWLTAQVDWERVGASYDSFAGPGLAVDGLPDGLREGVHDPRFTGLHRLEYGLWHGEGAASLLKVTDQLASSVSTLRQLLDSPNLAGDPTNLPIRAHEILEDALRDHLSGIDDEGAGAAYPETYGDLEATEVVLGELRPLLMTRMPKLYPEAVREMGALKEALLATKADGRWRSMSATPRPQRELVDAKIGVLLETLSLVPNVLEVPPRP